MGSSDRLFNRKRTVHEIFGGGSVADIILWRRKDYTLQVLIFTVASWMVFEIYGYTFLSFVSNVLLLLFVILFVWAKSSAIFYRPSPPLPHLHLSEETMREIADTIRRSVNDVIFMFEEIATGRDTRRFIQVAAGLLMISLLGSQLDAFSLCYICIFAVLTVPAFYEIYEDDIDNYALIGHRKLLQLYTRFHDVCINKIVQWRSEMKSS